MTNTNQASEDELTLENLLKFLCGEESISGRWFGEKYEGEPAFWWRPELKRLIRTEKLKLLAAVRERVVGDKKDQEYRLVDTEYASVRKEKVHLSDGISRNKLRNEQIDALNKLEAEL